MIAELFYSHILNISRGSLHTRSFRRIHLSVFKYRLSENGFAGQKVSGAFEKRASGPSQLLRHRWDDINFFAPFLLLFILLSRDPGTTLFFSIQQKCQVRFPAVLWARIPWGWKTSLQKSNWNIWLLSQQNRLHFIISEYCFILTAPVQS